MNPSAQRRVVVIDDDPTGSQAMSDVDVLLDADRTDFARFFAGEDRAVSVVANTRALDEQAAVARVRRILRAARAATETPFDVVLRGDSTLRGHVFAEIDAIAGPRSVTLFVPAFPDIGRRSLDGIQWVDVEGIATPADRTEFATDAHFGYVSHTLVDWVGEKGGGRAARMVRLSDLRARGPSSVLDALRSAPARGVVIPEIETNQDLDIVHEGLLAAERDGVDVVVRAAASFAAIRAGTGPRRLDRLSIDAPGRVLVACGSYTGASTAQLAFLTRQTGVEPVILDDSSLDDGSDFSEALERLRDDLLRHRLAIVSSSRAWRTSSDRGASIMQTLVAVVTALSTEADAIVAKGGITSAEIARSALGARRARVLGQLAVGVPVWLIETARGRVPYVVVPGNIGGPELLADLVGRLEHS